MGGLPSYDETEEHIYHEAYMTAGQKLDAFVAVYKDKLIGISIGCPLSKDITICADLVKTHLDIGLSYYFGDIIVEKEFWGNGIAKTLYEMHLEYIKKLGYKKVLALLVERNNNDSRKPTGFKKSRLWDAYHFKPTDYTVTYPWNTYTSNGKAQSEIHILRAYEKIV